MEPLQVLQQPSQDFYTSVLALVEMAGQPGGLVAIAGCLVTAMYVLRGLSEALLVVHNMTANKMDDKVFLAVAHLSWITASIVAKYGVGIPRGLAVDIVKREASLLEKAGLKVGDAEEEEKDVAAADPSGK